MLYTSTTAYNATIQNPDHARRHSLSLSGQYTPNKSIVKLLFCRRVDRVRSHAVSLPITLEFNAHSDVISSIMHAVRYNQRLLCIYTHFIYICFARTFLKVRRWRCRRWRAGGESMINICLSGGEKVKCREDEKLDWYVPCLLWSSWMWYFRANLKDLKGIIIFFYFSELALNRNVWRRTSGLFFFWEGV